MQWALLPDVSDFLGTRKIGGLVYGSIFRFVELVDELYVYEYVIHSPDLVLIV